MSSALRSATRVLVRWRGGAVVAALTLVIGTGTATGLYVLAPLMLADVRGVPDLNRLGRVYASSRALGVERSQVALNEYDSTLSSAKSFSAIGAYSEVDAVVSTGRDVRPVIAGYASPAFFRAMGVPPAGGRVFTAADITDARSPVILSQALWHRQFPDGRIENLTVVVDGVPRAVVGVMPPDFNSSFVGITADLWIPLGRASVRTPAIVNVFARLRDGVDWPAAQSELAAFSTGRGPTSSPPSRASSRDGQWTWRAIPIGDDTWHRALTAYGGALGAALLVLLIACVNVACLLMARGVERDKELSVRRALGATRTRVALQLLQENLLLAAFSGVGGGVLAMLMVRALVSQLAGVQPSLASRISVDISVLPVAVVTGLLAFLVFASTPALRLSKRDVAASLKGLPPAHRIQIAGYAGRDALVFAEIAASAGLVVWTAMLYTLLTQLGAVHFAFDADRVVAMRVPADTAVDVADRVAGIPGVTRTAISSGMLGGGERVRVHDDAGRSTVVSRVPVGMRFLDTLGVAIVRGRAFDQSEMNGGADVAILSESAARRLAPDHDVLGMQVRMPGRKPAVVVGICRDAIDYGALSTVAVAAPSELYVPYEPPVTGYEAVVLARMSVDPRFALRAIEAAAQIPAAHKPARAVIVSDDAERPGALGTALLVVKILFTFGLLALALAASGVFAVTSQSVAQRTREFGIRMAIGATPRRVLGMVLVRETKLIALGVGVGLVFTVGLTRALFVELVQLNTVAPGGWIAALLLTAGVASVAVALATYRIVRLEPAVVLRRS